MMLLAMAELVSDDGQPRQRVRINPKSEKTSVELAGTAFDGLPAELAVPGDLHAAVSGLEKEEHDGVSSMRLLFFVCDGNTPCLVVFQRIRPAAHVVNAISQELMNEVDVATCGGGD